MPADASGLAKALRGRRKGLVVSTAKEYAAAPPPEKLDSSAPDSLLADAFVSARRDFDPLWEPSPGIASRLRRAQDALRLRGIPQERWPEYVRWCFERFGEMKGSPRPIPVNLLHSDWFLDNFASELPARKLDWKRAKTMLRAHGYDGLVFAAVEVALAARGGKRVPRHGGGAYEAGLWLSERLDEVGTVEDET